MGYADKLVTAEQAVQLAVKDGDWVDYGFSTGFPELLDRALAARVGHVKDVKIRGGLFFMPQIEVIEKDPKQESFHYYSWHIGDYERKKQAEGLVSFMPTLLRLLPDLYRYHIRTDVAFVPVSVPDENGDCTLGTVPYCWKTIIENARTVVFEINEHYPRKIFGPDGSNKVNISQADYIVEGEHSPLPVRSYRAPSETDIKIAEHVLREIPDGACLSLGVGGVPFAVANMLKEGDFHHLGCWTGTLSDPMMDLYKAGKLDNSKKVLDKGLFSWNLASGSQALYEWLDEEPELFHPDGLDYIHRIENMCQNPDFISINGGVQLNLMGEENAESSGTRQLSGIGGQLDFLEAAYRSPGGKGFICMNSARKTKDGSLKSNIVANFTPGSATSAPRTLVQYAATEYGAVKLSGLSLKERAKAMISIAYPDFREELEKYAEESFK